MLAGQFYSQRSLLSTGLSVFFFVNFFGSELSLLSV